MTASDRRRPLRITPVECDRCGSRMALWYAREFLLCGACIDAMVEGVAREVVAGRTEVWSKP